MQLIIRKFLNAAAAVGLGVGAGANFIEDDFVPAWIILLAALIQAAAFGRIVDREDG